jgi:hypothetical protein
MTIFQITSLFEIHKEFNPDKFEQKSKKATIDEAFGGL